MTRAPLVVDLAYLATLIAPLAMFFSFRLVRAGRRRAHKRIQIGTLLLCIAAVLALEAEIRLSGGSGSFVSTASPAIEPWARGVLLVHITGAVLTYLAWIALAVTSARSASLPGGFSRRHRFFGKAIWGGLLFTAVSATAMFTLVFVA